MTTNAVSFEKTRTAAVINPDLSGMILAAPEILAAQAEVIAAVAARTAAVEARDWKLRVNQAIRAANPGATEAQINTAANRT